MINLLYISRYLKHYFKLTINIREENTEEEEEKEKEEERENILVCEISSHL